MAKELEKCVRILWVLRFLCEETCAQYGLTTNELIARLCEQGIGCDRRDIYNDLNALRFFGYDIIKTGRPTQYRLAGREFTLPELKLLVDAVQSSRFLTKEKSDELIGKIEQLCSRREARELSRSVHVQNRIKSMNESIYINVDIIQSGITKKRQIIFNYFNWNAEKRQVLRHDGRPYTVSPLALTWTDDNYYLIANDSERGKIRHFRVDRMIDIRLTERPCDSSERIDLALYVRSRFGMFGGEECAVRLECDNTIAGVIIDRFGSEPTFFRATDTTFEVTVRAVASPQFFGWVAGLGDKVAIRSPQAVVDDFRKYIDGIRRKYEH